MRAFAAIVYETPCGHTIVSDRLKDPGNKLALQKIAESMGFRRNGQWWEGKLRHGVETLEVHLRHAGFEVKTSTIDCIGHHLPPAITFRPSVDWMSAMFAALPDELRAKAYRALAHLVHPDVADAKYAQLAQQLNDAYAPYNGKRKVGAR